MLEIRGLSFTFRRVEGTKIDKCYLRKIQIKSIMIIYLREVSNIGNEMMLQKLLCAPNGEMV